MLLVYLADRNIKLWDKVNNSIKVKPKLIIFSCIFCEKLLLDLFPNKHIELNLHRQDSPQFYKGKLESHWLSLSAWSTCVDVCVYIFKIYI